MSALRRQLYERLQRDAYSPALNRAHPLARGLVWLTRPSAGFLIGNGLSTGGIKNLVDPRQIAVPQDANEYMGGPIGTPEGPGAAFMNIAAAPGGQNELAAWTGLSGLTELTLAVWFWRTAADTSRQWLNFRTDNQHSLDIFSVTSTSVTWGTDWTGAWNGASQKTINIGTGFVCLLASITQTGASFYNNGVPNGTKTGSGFTTSSSSVKVLALGPSSVVLGQAAWNRALQASEALAFQADVDQMLVQPRRQFVFPPPPAAAAQVGYPIADIATGGWLPSSGTDLFPMLDETTRDDSDYVYSPANPTTQYFEELLTSLLVPIAGAQGIKYTLRAQGQATHFVVDVRQGSTSLHVFTHDLTVAQGWQEFTQTITAVTNYADARVRITASAP